MDTLVHRIQPADPYPQDYEQTVARNVREQNADARPAIEGRMSSIDRYDVVILASPIWNVRAPMIMSTFAEALDFTGKTAYPVTTHAMSGLGRTERDYAESCRGATIGEGLAVRGEEVTDAEPALDAWLRRSPGPPARIKQGSVWSGVLATKRDGKPAFLPGSQKPSTRCRTSSIA